MSENIQIAVRVRPSKTAAPADDEDFAALRETYGEDGDHWMCVEMPDDEHVQLLMTPPRAVASDAPFASAQKDSVKEWTFPHCFWSHDREPSHTFADQRRVYDAIGRPLLRRCFEGYNACLFAYGQTGSGKTYTMMGLDKKEVFDKKIPRDVVEQHFGIIPRVFRDISDEIQRLGSVPGSRMEVRMSFLEIYNERVRDLLARQKNDRRGFPTEHEVKILNKDDGTIQFYRKDGGSDEEKTCAYGVRSLKDLNMYFEIGTTHRSVAATKMNGHSSRSHSVVVLHIVRRPRIGEAESNTQLFLVDLAGSENSSKTGAVGQQAAEAAAINTSLLELGNVINCKAMGQKVNTYRNSQLTMMLRNAIGGNSYTVMLGCVGPSSYNLPEIKNTLEYCARASTIQCKSVRMIRKDAGNGNVSELKSENMLLIQERDQLRKMLESLQAKNDDRVKQELEQVKSALEQKQLEIERQNITVNQASMTDAELMEEMKRLAESHLQSLQADLSAKGHDLGNSTLPLLINLHRDHTLDATVRYVLASNRELKLGAEGGCNIVVFGYNVRSHHATLLFRPGSNHVLLTPVSGGETRVNGAVVSAATKIGHNDRICFGENSLFRLDMRVASDGGTPTWKSAMRELAIGRGLFKENEWQQQKDELSKAKLELERLKSKLTTQSDEGTAQRFKELMQGYRSLEDKVSCESELVHYLEQARIASSLAIEHNLQPLVRFEPMIVSRRSTVGNFFKHEVVMKVIPTDDADGKTFVWPVQKFDDLLQYLQDMQLEEMTMQPGEVDDVSIGLSVDQEYGQAVIFLKPLLHLVSVEGEDEGSAAEHAVISTSGRIVGKLHAKVLIEMSVTEDEEDSLLEEVGEELLNIWRRFATQGKLATVTVVVERVVGIEEAASSGAYVAFSFDAQPCKTPKLEAFRGTAEFGFARKFIIPVSESFIQLLSEGSLTMTVMYSPEKFDFRARSSSPMPGGVLSPPAARQPTRTRSSSLTIERRPSGNLDVPIAAVSSGAGPGAGAGSADEVTELKRKLSNANVKMLGQMWKRKNAERRVLHLSNLVGSMSSFDMTDNLAAENYLSPHLPLASLDRRNSHASASGAETPVSRPRTMSNSDGLRLMRTLSGNSSDGLQLVRKLSNVGAVPDYRPGSASGIEITPGLQRRPSNASVGGRPPLAPHAADFSVETLSPDSSPPHHELSPYSPASAGAHGHSPKIVVGDHMRTPPPQLPEGVRLQPYSRGSGSRAGSSGGGGAAGSSGARYRPKLPSPAVSVTSHEEDGDSDTDSWTQPDSPAPSTSNLSFGHESNKNREVAKTQKEKEPTVADLVERLNRRIQDLEESNRQLAHSVGQKKTCCSLL